MKRSVLAACSALLVASCAVLNILPGGAPPQATPGAASVSDEVRTFSGEVRVPAGATSGTYRVQEFEAVPLAGAAVGLYTVQDAKVAAAKLVSGSAEADLPQAIATGTTDGAGRFRIEVKGGAILRGQNLVAVARTDRGQGTAPYRVQDGTGGGMALVMALMAPGVVAIVTPGSTALVVTLSAESLAAISAGDFAQAAREVDAKLPPDAARLAVAGPDGAARAFVDTARTDDALKALFEGLSGGAPVPELTPTAPPTSGGTPTPSPSPGETPTPSPSPTASPVLGAGVYPVSVTVTPASTAAIYVPGTVTGNDMLPTSVQLFATVRMSDDSTVSGPVSWSSARPDDASVDSAGLVNVLAPGATPSVRITAVTGSVSGYYDVPVERGALATIWID